MFWLGLFGILYLVFIFAFGMVYLFDDSERDRAIRFNDIEHIAHIIAFMFTGPALVVYTIFALIGKGLTCKFRERK